MLKVVVEIMARHRVALMCLGLALCYIGFLRGDHCSKQVSDGKQQQDIHFRFILGPPLLCPMN